MSIKVEFGIRKDEFDNIIYNDVSDYLRDISIARGKSNALSTYDAATIKVSLSNELRLFDPSYTPSPFSQDILPTGSIRIWRQNQILATGYITDWNLMYDQSGDAVAEVSATDAFWLLNNKTLSEDVMVEQRTDERIAVILGPTKANWSLADREISQGLAVLGDDTISEGTGVLAYLQQIEASEPGRLFMSKDGKIVFKSRADSFFASIYDYTRQNLSTNPSFTNDTVGWTVTTGALVRSTVESYVGSSSGHFSTTPAVAYQAFNAVANSTYTASVYVYCNSNADITLTAFESSDGTTFTQTITSTTTVVSGSWQRLFITFDISDISVANRFQIGTNVEAFIDGILIEESPLMLDYFDGDDRPADVISPSITYTSVWDGI